ncbi:MAG: hypothetical protein LT082_08825 [Comamonas sp.]|nr:hypothetical protein [Comamonas sp.]
MWQWYLVPALLALERNVTSTRRQITTAELAAWATDGRIDFVASIAEMAFQSLQRQGYAQEVRVRTHARFARKWRLTTKGLQAAQAAAQAQSSTGPDVRALSTRLWNLLRIRRRLTALDAAQTLADAGDDFSADTRRIATLLAAWAKHAPEAVVVSQKREAGCLRYVLIKDLGRWPPPARAGLIHPTAFDKTMPIPARYLVKRAGADTGAAPQ